MKDLPKIELHLHHEGAAPPAFIRGLAKEKGVDLSGIFREDGSYAYRDFWHFLSVYEAATSVLQTPEDYAPPDPRRFWRKARKTASFIPRRSSAPISAGGGGGAAEMWTRGATTSTPSARRRRRPSATLASR